MTGLTPSAAAQGAGSVVTIKNANSGLCVDTGGSSGFALLLQANCSGASSQNFVLANAPVSGYYYLANSTSQLCWDIVGGSVSSGALLQQYTCVAATAEYFKLTPVSSGVYKISSSSGLCMGAVGGSTASGGGLAQTACDGSANQTFQLNVMGTPLPGSVVTVRDMNSGLCVDSGGSNSFSLLFQAGCSGSASQSFTLRAAPVSGYYYLANATSQLCWDIAGGSASSGAFLQQYTCVAATPEYFRLIPVSAGVYKIIASAGLCMGAAGASTASGAGLAQTACDGSNNQNFQISTVGGTASISPSITSQPASRSVTAGQTASFAVVATGTAPMSYQWNKNGTAISGATASSYTTPATTSSDSGAQFAVMVTNSVGNVTSNAATLTVNAAAAGQLSAVPSSVSFGNVTTSTNNSQTIKLTNTGASSVSISQANVTGAGFSTSGLTLPATIAGGQSVNFNVIFAPTSAGPVTGSLSLVSTASNSPLSVPLSGTGAAPTLLLGANPTSLSFGSVNVNSNSSLTATLTNSGNSDVKISGVTTTGTGFSASGLSAGTTLSAGQSATLNVTFAPTTAGSTTGSITVASNATNSPATISLSGTGASTSGGGPTVNVKNYGAAGDGSTNDTTAIQNAIAALSSGATLVFPCGTYLTTSQLTIGLSNITIDGSGCATIHNTSSGTIMVIGGSGNGNPNYGSAVALSATANELATSFSTVSSLSVAAGDYVRLQQGGKDSSNGSGDTACDPSGCRGEVLKVASVSGNTITVTTALHDAYSPSVNGATAQKLLSPLTGVTVKNITFDGNGSNVYGLAIAGVVESTVNGVTAKNVQGAALLNRGDFNVAWSNISVTGAGSAQCGSAVWFENQGNLSVNAMTISNENPGAPGSGCLANGAFGFELIASANSTVTNLTVDAAGAYGRPFKTTAARYNTFNSPVVKNGVQAYNGISLEYYSSHNAYNNCVVTNNGAGTGTGTGNAGIITFGNFNQYNSFNNCTVSGNGNVQFYISGFDALRLAQDHHNTISGGSYTGSNNVEAVILIEGGSAMISGAAVGGPGAQGLYLDSQASNACVNNNSFTAGSGLGTAISANGSGDLGLGNILNALTSNLSVGVCSAPLP